MGEEGVKNRGDKLSEMAVDKKNTREIKFETI
jgi:hypothetical protein